MRGIIIALLAALCVAAPASAEFRPIEMAIPFADHGGIRDWRALDSDTLYVQDRRGNWYRAELSMPAPSLHFREAIGFETSPSGRFDRWSAIVLNGQRYNLKSLTASGPPLPRELAKEFG